MGWVVLFELTYKYSFGYILRGSRRVIQSFVVMKFEHQARQKTQHYSPELFSERKHRILHHFFLSRRLSQHAPRLLTNALLWQSHALDEVHIKEALNEAGSQS